MGDDIEKARPPFTGQQVIAAARFAIAHPNGVVQGQVVTGSGETGPGTPAVAATRVPFTDLARLIECVLVIPPDGRVHPAAPGDPKIGVEHPGCIRVADLALELDAFYCPKCQWNGRISGHWAADLINAAAPGR